MGPTKMGLSEVIATHPNKKQMKRKREIVYFLQYNQYTVSPIIGNQMVWCLYSLGVPRLDCSKKNKKNLRFYKLDVSFDTTNSVARWILHSSAYSQESSILNTSHMWSSYVELKTYDVSSNIRMLCKIPLILEFRVWGFRV